MHSTSSLWKALLEDPDHYKVMSVRIAGTAYTRDRIESLKVSGRLFDTPTVGNSVARQIDLTFLPAGEIPRLAKIELFIALTNGAQTSEQIPKGVFYIDTRTTDTETGWMTIHGFDAILMMEQVYNGPSSTADKAMEYIAGRIHTAIDPRTEIRPYPVPGADNSMTMRKVANYIAALHGGNWIITDAGNLYLMPLAQNVPVLGTEAGEAISFGGEFLLA